MKKALLIILLVFTVIISFSQSKENEDIYLFKFKIYQYNIDNGIPNAEAYIVDKLSNKRNSMSYANKDGYFYFQIDTTILNLDSCYLSVIITKRNNTDANSKPIEVPLNQVELYKVYNFEHQLSIKVIMYKKASKKELRKYPKQYNVMPARTPVRAIDVH